MSRTKSPGIERQTPKSHAYVYRVSDQKDAVVMCNSQIIYTFLVARKASVVLVLLHKFDEGFLVYKARVLSVAEHTDVSQAQLNEALVDQVNR